MNQYIFIIHIMNLLLHFLHFFNTFQCIRCRNCTIDFVSYKCLFRSLIVRLWTGVVLDMLCLQKNRGRNWGIFDPNDFLKLFLKRMDFMSLALCMAIFNKKSHQAQDQECLTSNKNFHLQLILMSKNKPCCNSIHPYFGAMCAMPTILSLNKDVILRF